MATIATLAVKLLADAAGFLSAMDQAEKKSQTWSMNVSKNLKDVGEKMTDFGQKATMGLTVPIAGAGLAAVKLASDYEETKNKALVVFGEMGDSVVKNADKANTTLGMSARAYLDYASSIGASLTAGGMGVQDATALSEQAVKHFADLASFHNSTAEEASGAWQSAIRGQYESIQKYFPFINNDYMKTYGVAQGLIDENTENLTANQRAIILNAIAMNESLNPALNDFAETSDGLANQQRSLTAQLEDAGRVLGSQLLPYALQFVQWASDMVAKFQALSPQQQKWLMIILGVAAAIGPVLMVVGSLVTAIGAIIPVATAVGGVLSGIALPLLLIIGVLALLYFAWTNNWGGIQQKTQAVIEFIKGLIAGGMQFISDLTSGKLGWLSQIWNNTVGGIQALWQLFTTNIKLIGQAFTAAFHGDWYSFGEKLRMVWDNIWTGIKLAAQIAWENIKILFSNAVTNIINFFRDTDWGQVGRNIIEGIANGLKSAASGLVNAAINAASNALEAVKGFLGIHSESKVFKRQVGWEMGAGTTSGWVESINKLLMPSFGMLTPAMETVMPQSPAPGANIRRGENEGERRMLELLEEIVDKETINYEKLARMVRDAVLMRSQ